MPLIGIDVGSTYTKYCIMDDDQKIISLFSDKTPVRQKEYFDKKIYEITQEYPSSPIVSCGYGRKNISAIKNISELTALALGSHYSAPDFGTTLDIGGQDTKIICHKNGTLNDFFINDRCAAGSGLFLANICSMLDTDFHAINLSTEHGSGITLSSVCAVFAQTEIVDLVSKNVPTEDIVQAVIKQIFIQAKNLLRKVKTSRVLLSGGLSQIKGIDAYASDILGVPCLVHHDGAFLSAIGCAICARNAVDKSSVQ